MYDNSNDTIAAVATGSGGAISVIRVSGPRAVEVCDRIFRPVSNSPLVQVRGYTVHYGTIADSDGAVVDEVLVTVFRSPRSYTGEDMAEISCHGSSYIRQRIMSLLIAFGARAAAAGEFTMRAFMAGKLDLSQAEAVADMIASEDRTSHSLAINQMRGGYSEDFRVLRARLLELASLLELELDFSEEDVTFADRGKLSGLIDAVRARVGELEAGYLSGNAVKVGIPVAIAGEPNTGKSTLLNALVKEERAMVSDIAGTTRDVIEESIVIEGIKFRFIDTAGLRQTDDMLENMGIERARSSISGARVVLYIIAPDSSGNYDIGFETEKISRLATDRDAVIFLLLNKVDTVESDYKAEVEFPKIPGKELRGIIPVSARHGIGIDMLRESLAGLVDTERMTAGETIVTNTRHYEALLRTDESLARASEGIENGTSSDILAEDIKDAIHHLGTVTGEITNDEILGSIFSKFCVGK